MFYSKTLRKLMTSVLAVLLVCLCVYLFVMDDDKEHSFNRETLKRTFHGKEFDNLRQQKKLLLLSNDTVIDSLDETGLTDLYWRYINSLQVVCNNQTRLGSLQNGGKEICFDDTYRSMSIYSFGSNFQFDFELAAKNHFGCEIHTFDPSRSLDDATRVPEGITFHLTGLDGHAHSTSKNWKMDTLSNIRKSLNHENKTIDILKIDVEGSEWAALPQMYKSGVLKDVKQLSIEIRYDRTRNVLWGNTQPKEQLKVLRGLYEQGFLIFIHERNLGTQRVFSNPFYQTITNVNEISLLNMRYMF